MDREQTETMQAAIKIASDALSICYELNTLDGEYADGVDGPFAASRECARRTLALAFGEKTADRVLERVWDCDEYSQEDLARFILVPQE